MKQKAGASMRACAGTVLQSWHWQRCYLGLPRKPADAAPAALALHELRVQRGTESWLLQLQAGLWWAVVEAFLQSISCSHSPPLPSPHPSTGTTTQACFPPPPFQLWQRTQRSLLTITFIHVPSDQDAVTAFQSVWMFWSRLFPGSRDILLTFLNPVHWVPEEPLISTCFYKPRESWKHCTISTDLERITPEFTVIIFPLGNSHDSEGNCHTGESSTRWIITAFANAALTLLSSSLPLWYPQQENCCGTCCILEKSPFWLKSPFRINFYHSLIRTHPKAALFAHKH